MSKEPSAKRGQGTLGRLLDRGAGATEGVTKDLLSAVWSFLRHPTVLEDRVVDVEDRLAAVERRIVGDLKAAVEDRIVAAEQGVVAIEQRLEEDLRGAVRSRVSALDARLSALRTRVVENLKTELRRALLVLALGAGAGVLALVGAIFALMTLWLSLRGVLGAVSASLVLSVAFFVLSVGALVVLSSVRRPRPTNTAPLT